MATKVILYKPDKPEQYLNVTNVEVKDGVLTFYWKANAGAPNKKIVTTVRFLVDEDIAG
jgi:hypothetical protein